MKILGNRIRIGMILSYHNSLFKVIKLQHVKPGKGGAYAQVELKDILNGRKLNERFRSDESIDKVTLEQKDCQFSYLDQDNYVFMDMSNYEQISIHKDNIPEHQLPYLLDNIAVTMEFYDDKPIGLILPQSVILKVIETEAVIKGQTVTSSFKPATMENGIRVMVPQHIDVDTLIVVSTEDNSYVEKAK